MHGERGHYRGRRSGLGALLLALLLAAGGSPGQARDIRIGVLDYAGSGTFPGHWAPTRAALSAALAPDRVELVARDLPGLEQALDQGQFDFVITNPGHYAELEYRHHVSRIATVQGDLPVASTLVTRGDLSQLRDLAGKRLAIVDPAAFGGFEVIWREMAEADNALPGKVHLLVTGYPMQTAAQAVLEGRADAAVLRGCLLERLQAQDPARYAPLHAFALRPAAAVGAPGPADVLLSESAAALRAGAGAGASPQATPQTPQPPQAAPAQSCALSSRIYPGWPFAKTARTDPALAKRVAVALMQMQAGNLWTVPLDYQPVHDLLRELRIGPYARTGPVSVAEFIADYRDWLIGLACALVFWAIYSVRIETLVRRRTRALDLANAGLRHEMAERRRAEEADRQHRRELEHVARLSILGEMASSIAHELNQPLSAISTYAQGLAMRLAAGRDDPAELSHACAEITQQSERAALVVRRIRAFVRKRDSQLGTVDLAGLMDESAALFEATTRRAGLRVETLLAPGLPSVQADRVQLQQVVLNLVQNAVDAMETTPPEERRLLIRSEAMEDPQRGPGLCLSFRDRGIGLEEAGLARFAEAFHTTKPEGIGLGLALSRSIIEAHGGWLRAERPADGCGLRVMLWLPAAKGPDPKGTTGAGEQDKAGPGKGGR